MTVAVTETEARGHLSRLPAVVVAIVVALLRALRLPRMSTASPFFATHSFSCAWGTAMARIVVVEDEIQVRCWRSWCYNRPA